jgi:hypothetical protein
VPPPAALDSREIVLEAEVDRHDAYVGQQVIYTQRLMHAVPISNAEIQSLEASNVRINPLQDREYQKSIGGKTYRVIEKRYALFIDKAGTITIPAQVFSATISDGSRSRYSFGFGDPFTNGRSVRLGTEPITLNVRTVPDAFTQAHPGANWLPATDITLREDWSSDLDSARVGEPLTRTITLLAKGLASSSLALPTVEATDKLNQYPEKPQLLDEEWHGGVAGELRQSVALIPVTAGRYEIPAMEIPWWNTETDRLETARLPARHIDVAAAALSASSPPHAVENDVRAHAPPVAASTADTAPRTVASAGNHWRAVAITAIAGWLLTLVGLLFFWQHRQKDTPVLSTGNGLPNAHTGNQTAWQTLRDACRNNDAACARSALDRWLLLREETTGASGQPDATRAGASQLQQHPHLRAAVDELNACLYREASPAAWRGDKLLAAADALRQQPAVQTDKSGLRPLYPSLRQ